MPDHMLLLVTIVDKGKGDEVISFLHDNKVDYSFLTYAKGTVRSEMLNLLGLGSVDKDILFSLLPRHEVKTHMAGLSGLLKLKHPGKGVAFSIPLDALNALVAKYIGDEMPVDETEETTKEVKSMSSKFNLVVAVVEQGFVDQVMDVARAAGATGGTLIHARGVGRESNETFLGSALQSEKEIVFILSPHQVHNNIMNELNEHCGLLTGAKGIVFSLPVENVAGIGL